MYQSHAIFIVHVYKNNNYYTNESNFTFLVTCTCAIKGMKQEFLMLVFGGFFFTFCSARLMVWCYSTS